jgi:hypothetical protein
MLVALAGGYFAWYVMIHFASDFLTQSHYEAINKHHNAKIRAKHCLIYALSFLPFFWWFGMPFWHMAIALNILFWTHFGEDTYAPVLWWVKYVRRPPMFANLNRKLTWRISSDDQQAFRAFIAEPIGTILMIAVDQIIHLACLIPIVYLTITRLI